MIYMEANSIGWDSLALSWLNRCNPIWSNDEYKSVIMATLRWIIPDCLMFIRKNCHQFLMPGEINIVMTTLSIFEMLLNDAIEENADEYVKFLTSWFQAAISYSVVWGLSGIMNTESRIIFDEFYREVYIHIVTSIMVGDLLMTALLLSLLLLFIHRFGIRRCHQKWEK